MATEKIQTELVITNLAHGQSQQDLQGAIQAQQLLSTGPRKQVAQALAGSGALGDETQLLNAFARMLGARAGSIIRAAGTPVPTGRDRVNRRGEVMLDEEGNPIPEMQTPTVSARVRSDPNAHRSERERQLIRERLTRKTVGRIEEAPSTEEMKQLIERASAEDVTHEELLDINNKIELFQQQKRESQRAERVSAARTRRAYQLKTGIGTYDPETGLRTFQRPLTPEQVQAAITTVNDAFAYEPDRVEADFTLKEELRTRRERARHTRETSKYDQKALKEIDQIEKDVEATRKRLDTTKMRERLDAANAKLDRPGFMSMLRDVLGRKPMDFNVPLEGPVPGPRARLTPMQEREQRFIDKNKELDEKVAAYRKMSRDERVAPEGRAALEDIRTERAALREQGRELTDEQRAEQERERLVNQASARRYSAMGKIATQAAGDVFDPNRSIATTGLLSAGGGVAGMFQQEGVRQIATGGSSGLFLKATGALALVNLLKSGLERGTELQKSAEKVYTEAEPMFAREQQLRAARGLTSVRAFSPEAQKRADAAQRKLGTPDLPTAASGTPEDKDIYSKTTTTNLRILQQNLGQSMGLSAAVQAYGQFRRQAGVTDMNIGDASLLMKTGIMAGLPQELVARATQLGAIRGNVGGGVRTGLDQRMDIGTLRYQQETLARAGLMGAPAEGILGQTLGRQEAMAALGMRTDFDRDAKFQRVLQEQGIAPQQFGAITGGVDEMRMGALQQLQAPGKEILSGLMMADAFRRGKTVTGAAEYLAKTSSAEILENQLKTIGPGSGLLPLVAMSMAPADQPAMMEALRRMREGQTAGPAAATGEGTIDQAATERGRLEYMPEYSAIGAQRSMGNKAEIAEFQQTLDTAAKGIRAAADSLQSVAASAGNLFT